MDFRKCIELNALVKAHREDRRAGYDRVSVSFNMYDIGHWAAEVTFPVMMFSSEMQDILGWALGNCSFPFVSCRGGNLVLNVL